MLLFVVGPQYTIRKVGNDVNTLSVVLFWHSQSTVVRLLPNIVVLVE
jgi:hypothetical protein